jgi:hypothetical protein
MDVLEDVVVVRGLLKEEHVPVQAVMEVAEQTVIGIVI